MSEKKEPGKIVKHQYLKTMATIAEKMDELDAADYERVRSWLEREYVKPAAAKVQE